MRIKVGVQKATLQKTSADAMIIGIFQNSDELTAEASDIDRATGGAISELLASGDFKGKTDEVVTLYPRGAIQAERVIVVGLGERTKAHAESLREASAIAAKHAKRLGVPNLATSLHAVNLAAVTDAEAAEAVVEGSLLALYKYNAAKSVGPSDRETEIESLTLIEKSGSRLKALKSGASAGLAIAEGVHLARTLVNQPGNIATARAIARATQLMCKEAGLSSRILNEKEIHREKMGLLLAVNQGSAQPAQFIIIEHKPAKTKNHSKPVVLIGKGVTFDTGGYSLKPQAGMVGMKGDMSGAAAVIGTMCTVGRLGLPLHVIALVPAVENMISSNALKPNDILTSRKGLTVEVINTDAEGRLILADALSYADSLSPGAVIDVATLTGAKRIALGPRTNAVFTTDDKLSEALSIAGQSVAEPVWRMPLDASYDSQLKSEVADLKNDGGPDAVPITAARFLARFAGDWPWAHIDIAGSQFYAAGPEQNPRSYMTPGASGTPTRLLIQFLRNRSSSDQPDGQKM